LMKDMISIFKEQVPEFVLEMKTHFQNKDWKSLASVAHKAKSTISIIGLTDLIVELKIFEENVLNSVSINSYLAFIQNFETTCNKAIIQLDTIISERQ
jgi:HPt (histidine-containing phosphotransfer) domain-containing protein